MSQHAPESNDQSKRGKAGPLDGVDVQEAVRGAAAPDARERARRRQIGLALVLAVSGAAAVTLLRLPDTMDGPRPEAALMNVMPLVIQAYQVAARGTAGMAPTPAQVSAVVAKTAKRKVVIVGPGVKAPNAVRLGGTPGAPAVELLDERGEIALYGDMPVVFPVEVN